MLVDQEDGSVVLIGRKVINDDQAKACVKTHASQQEVCCNALMASEKRAAGFQYFRPASDPELDLC